MPATGVVEPSIRRPVSSEPHSLPLANETCCMRESLLGRRCSGLTNGVAPTSGAQLGVAMHCAGGMLPGCWNDVGGTAYGIVATPRTDSTGSTVEASDAVFVIVHCRTRLSTPFCVNTACELSMNSVPPLVSW